MGILLAVALPLAAVDLIVKAMRPTEEWAYHERSLGWLLLSIALLVGMLVVAQVPSKLVAPAAGIVAGGVLANALSASWNGMAVPNPLLVGAGDGMIAFNLADVWALTGIVSLVCVLAIWLIRNHERFPSTAEMRERRGEALRRLFDQNRS